MIPITIFGSFIGTMISSVMPDAILTIIITLLMVYLTVDSSWKAVSMWKKESKASLANLQV